ncbi:hypothetical protein ABZU32_02310 [Sphaerisporangium sp. NPDC005288]|uniref:hypothetical protein n=1 Tax=Sphaerisporangium sp. NPDC005288 TaxID=3155114 RepID=UPI0033AC6137
MSGMDEDVRPGESLVDLARGWEPDPAYDYSLGVRDIIWEEVPESRQVICVFEGIELREAKTVVPGDSPYQYLLELRTGVFDPALAAGDMSILRECIAAFGKNAGTQQRPR